MAKYRGRVDCYLEPIIGDGNSNSSSERHSRANGEFFVNLVQLISSSMEDLGIEMLAWNYGIDGGKWNFWDQPGPVGRGAFACFRFHSASLGKFDCFIYENTGSYNSHTGSVYIDNSNSSVYGDLCYHQVGIAFACHPSGSVTDTYPDVNGPWDGGYGENAWVQTTTELWKTTPAGKGAFFPRPNGIIGESSGSRAALQGLGGVGMDVSRNHFIISEDSVTILSDAPNDGSYRIMHFGPYIPRSGVIADSPYVMWSSGNEGSNSPWVNKYGSTIGSTSRTSNAAQGSLAHPDIFTGSVNFSWNWIGENYLLGLNKFVENGIYEKFPVWVTLNEASECGTLGVLKHLYYGVGMPNMSVSALSSSVAMGRNSVTEGKVLLPWSGNPPSTGPHVRTGRNFSIG